MHCPRGERRKAERRWHSIRFVVEAEAGRERPRAIDLESQGLVWTNVAPATFAVGQGGGNEEVPGSSGFHELKTLGPTRDDGAQPKS